MDSHDDNKFTGQNWVSSIGSPLWVTDPFGDICFINDPAQQLLGYSATECIGKPCYRIVRGTEYSGEPYCTPNCPAFNKACGNRPIDPIHLSICRPDGKKLWIQVLIITIHDYDPLGNWLIHCAMDDNRAHRIEEYLTKVVSRTPCNNHSDQNLDLFALTKRESEILLLLSTDETLHAIAYKLNLSYATIRNHVHHILSKLGVHSVMEAVAHFLLTSTDKELANSK